MFSRSNEKRQKNWVMHSRSNENRLGQQKFIIVEDMTKGETKQSAIAVKSWTSSPKNKFKFLKKKWQKENRRAFILLSFAHK